MYIHIFFLQDSPGYSRFKRFKNLAFVSNSECEKFSKKSIDPGTLCAADRDGSGQLCFVSI